MNNKISIKRVRRTKKSNTVGGRRTHTHTFVRVRG